MTAATPAVNVGVGWWLATGNIVSVHTQRRQSHQSIQVNQD